MPTALFLSPHLDDAAFSAGGTVAKLARAGCEVVVATAFTRSVPNPTGFALACQLDKGLDAGVDYMAIRRAEDAASNRALGARPLHLDLPEAPHRDYHSAPELFAAPRGDDGIIQPLGERLKALLADLAPDLVFAPQCLGGHVDHVLLAHALLGLRPADWVCWWRDLPYAIRHPESQPLTGLPLGRQHAVDIAATLAVKLDGCAAFGTQLAFQFGSDAAMRSQLSAFAHAEAQAVGQPLAAERFLGAAPELPR